MSKVIINWTIDRVSKDVVNNQFSLEFNSYIPQHIKGLHTNLTKYNIRIAILLNGIQQLHDSNR